MTAHSIQLIPVITTAGAWKTSRKSDCSGARNSEIATDWNTVFSLPPFDAGMTRLRMTMNRNTVIPSSRRPLMWTVPMDGSCFPVGGRVPA